MFTVPPEALPYDPYDEASILTHGLRLSRRTVGDVARELGYQSLLEDTNRGKGKVGNLVEAWFRLEANQRPDADFPCGVELKVAPLRQNRGGSFGAKERMVLGMIPFFDIVNEEWRDASVRKKIGRMLFIIYLHDPEDQLRSVFQSAMLWSPPEKDLPQIEVDWTRTRDMVRSGLAHELSESLGRVMGPCTKGAGGSNREQDLVPQPFHPTQRAKRRAFAFKGGYAWVQVQRHRRPGSIVSGSYLFAERIHELRLDDATLMERTGRTRIEVVESEMLSRLHRFEGLSLGDVCESLQVPRIGGGKSLAARLVNGILGMDAEATIEELAQGGVAVKTVHARIPGARPSDADWRPFEAMSFPAVDFDELRVEDWDEGTASFPEEIGRLLIIPTLSHRNSSPQADRLMDKAFFWSPTHRQMEVIEQDWREIQTIVASGGAAERPEVDAKGRARMRTTSKRVIPMTTNELPGERVGHILHMRPHARDADDKVAVPGGFVTRQAIWLNKGFIHTLLRARTGDAPESVGLTVS